MRDDACRSRTRALPAGSPEHSDQCRDDDECGTDELQQLVELAELDRPLDSGIVDARRVGLGEHGVEVIDVPSVEANRTNTAMRRPKATAAWAWNWRQLSLII